MRYETIEHLKETDFKRLTGVQRETFGQIENENFITQLRTKLGDTAFEEAWASGQSMSLEKAVSLAVGKYVQNKSREAMVSRLLFCTYFIFSYSLLLQHMHRHQLLISNLSIVHHYHRRTRN